MTNNSNNSNNTQNTSPEGIVQGTDGNDVIDLNYTGDPDGDRIDNDDGVNGTVGDEDFVLARDGDDTVEAGAGDDLVLGEDGDDTLRGQDGDDILYGGDGDDTLEGGDDNDLLRGGSNDDILDGGDGDDVIYGDTNQNILSGDTENATTFAQYTESGAWTVVEDGTTTTLSQTMDTVDGAVYTLTFDLAANLGGGFSAASIEVLWNGELVEAVNVESGIYESQSITVTGVGDTGELTFRALPPEDAPVYNFDGPIVSYDKEMTFGDDTVTVQAFAPGQAKLYQVITSQLKVFDVESQSYQDADENLGVFVNGIGFDVETDMLYGVSRDPGIDALGNVISAADIIAIDATGRSYRVGEGSGDFSYIGDFDGQGNLWNFEGSLNQVAVTDVSDIDANGNPKVTIYDIGNNIFTKAIFDVAYSAEDECFYAVRSTNADGGRVVRIDMRDVPSGGDPVITEIPISSTLIDGTAEGDFPQGAYGAVFVDGDGNLYAGLNTGNHDLSGSTGDSGAIYKITPDWNGGNATAELMSTSQTTTANDGAVDPRSADAFVEIDPDATLLLRQVELVEDEVPGDDTIIGGQGDDEIYGEEGTDTLSGGDGNDTIDGGEGDDIITTGDGNDSVDGGEGSDTISDVNAGDTIDGGSEGSDIDVLDLVGSHSPGGSFTVFETGPDSNGNGTNGYVEYYDKDGNFEGRLDFEEIESFITCFTPGASIATANGPRRVESLRLGDRIETRDDGAQEIVWIGRKDLEATELAQTPSLCPIRIRAGALGPGNPAEDLIVSPQHRVGLASPELELLYGETEMLLPAVHLLHLDGVDRVAPKKTSYIHFMFEKHQLVLSNGAWTESFQPGDYSLRGLDQGARRELYRLFPELAHCDRISSTYASCRPTLSRREAVLVSNTPIGM